MKALKIFTIIISIVLFSTTAHAKFYYNFGLNLGIGALGWNNYDDGYAVAVVPYAPVVATPVYTPLPYSYVSYYDYGNCGWWPNVSLSLNLGGGGYCGGYYGNYYGGYGYDSYYSPFNVSIGWGNYYPNWGNSCGYYGSYGYNRYRYGYGYGGYGYGCNNYYINNNYYYNNYPATARRPPTIRENNIPYQNRRESRNSLRKSVADNGRHNRLEKSGSKTRIARSERNLPGSTSGRTRSERSISEIAGTSRNKRSEIFAGRNSLPNYRSTRERVSRTPLTRTSRVSQPTRQRTPTRTTRISQPTRQRTPTRTTRVSQPTRQRTPTRTTRISQPTRQRTPTRTTRISQPTRQRTPTRTTRVSQPTRQATPSRTTRISQPTRQRTPTRTTRISQPTRQATPSRISRPSAPRVSAPRISRPSAPRVSAPRMSSRAPSSSRTTSMAMPVQSGGRMMR